MGATMLELNQVYNMNCLDGLKLLDSNSIDSIVTDPPYELGFMGKSWDNTGIAYNVELWKQALRVLKPGGHLLAFGGTRTYHRMACAIEDAGFEIRDQIQWLYGSGFPKSLNIGKAVEGKLTIGSSNTKDFSKLAGERKQRGDWGMHKLTKTQGYRGKDYGYETEQTDRLGKLEATTPEAKQWEGWGTSLKPANEPICVARKPLSEKTVAENVLKWGTGGINIDGCRVETDDLLNGGGTSNDYDGWGKSLCSKTDSTKANQLGRFPANIIHDGSDEVVELFPSPHSAGNKKKSNITAGKSIFGIGDIGERNPDTYGDSGSAARFFYCAKASKSERDAGLGDMEGRAKCETDKMGGSKCSMKTGSGNERNVVYKNNHPTVKPIALIEYLVKLVTPKGGVSLDLFEGSGTHALACENLDFDYLGFELEKEYMTIIQKRLEAHKSQLRLEI